MKEAQLIGNILAEEENEAGGVREDFSFMPNTNSAMHRPQSAPPSLPFQSLEDYSAYPGEIPDLPDELNPQDPRFDPSYYNFYYSQRTMDPRAPLPPVAAQHLRRSVPSSHHQQGNGRAYLSKDQLSKENELVDSVASSSHPTGNPSSMQRNFSSSPYQRTSSGGGSPQGSSVQVSTATSPSSPVGGPSPPGAQGTANGAANGGQGEDSWNQERQHPPGIWDGSPPTADINPYESPYLPIGAYPPSGPSSHMHVGKIGVGAEYEQYGGRPKHWEHANLYSRGMIPSHMHSTTPIGPYVPIMPQEGFPHMYPDLSSQMERMMVSDENGEPRQHPQMGMGMYREQPRLVQPDMGDHYSHMPYYPRMYPPPHLVGMPYPPALHRQMNAPSDLSSPLPPMPHQLAMGQHPSGQYPPHSGSYIRYDPSAQPLRVPNSPLVAVDPQFFQPHYPPVMAVEDPSSVMDWPAMAQNISIPKMDDENPYGPESITASDPPDAFATHPVIAPYYDPDGRAAELNALQQNGAVQIVKPHNRGGPRPRIPNYSIDGDERQGMMAEKPQSSSLLEEFRNNKSRKFTLQDIKGYVVEFSRDQYGSRFIQQKLEEATPEESQMIFEEIHHHAFRLMVDVFGNYVIQKFFEHGTKQQIDLLGEALFGHVLFLSLQIYGCRVIQKALEVISVEQKGVLVNELVGNVMKCVKDQNGNHVIQKCIECVPPNLIQFIVDGFAGKVLTLASHPYGCRVIQRILEHCISPDAARAKKEGEVVDSGEEWQAPILVELLKCTVQLVQDQYGNYVIQHVLVNGRPEHKLTIVQKLKGSYLKLSKNKFGSNVVEKCVQYSGDAERDMIIEEIVGTEENCAPLQSMMRDQYGNYVIQKVLDHVDEARRQFIIRLIKQHIPLMRKFTYSKHIIARVEKEDRKYTGGPGSNSRHRGGPTHHGVHNAHHSNHANPHHAHAHPHAHHPPASASQPSSHGGGGYHGVVASSGAAGPSQHRN